MSQWYKILDPSGKNFMGLGERYGRIMGALATGNTTEFHRSDPFFSKPGTGFNRWARSVGGSGPAAVGGYITGGPYGAVAGGVTGALAEDQGLANNTSAAGWGKNFGMGLGAGGVAGYARGLYTGGSGGGWAGSLAGGGAGAGGGSSAAPAATQSPYARAFQMAQNMPGQQQQPQQQAPMPSQADTLAHIYQIYPQLRPRLGGY